MESSNIPQIHLLQLSIHIHALRSKKLIIIFFQDTESAGEPDINNEDLQYNSSENEAVEEEDENNEDQSYSRSTKRPLKSRKEQSKGSSDLKSVAGEVVTSTLEYFKEKKHTKVPVDADSTFGQHVTNSLQAMEDVPTKEYAKLKIQ